MRKLVTAVLMGAALLSVTLPALAAGDLDGRSAELHEQRLAPVSVQAPRFGVVATSSSTTGIRVEKGADARR